MVYLAGDKLTELSTQESSKNSYSSFYEERLGNGSILFARNKFTDFLKNFLKLLEKVATWPESNHQVN